MGDGGGGLSLCGMSTLASGSCIYYCGYIFREYNGR